MDRDHGRGIPLMQGKIIEGVGLVSKQRFIAGHRQHRSLFNDVLPCCQLVYSLVDVHFSTLDKNPNRPRLIPNKGTLASQACAAALSMVPSPQ